MKKKFWVMVVIMAGCASVPLRESSFEIAGYDKAVKDYSSFYAQAGEDVVNISPTIALTGGGWVFFVICLIGLVRSRRTLKSIVRAIEQLDPTISQSAKNAILRQVLDDKVADYLHRIVRDL